MAELYIDKKYYNTLYIEGFFRMMKDPSYCYKFYWLEAIVHLISEGRDKASYDELINEMIANAWYSVLEFHVHLSGINGEGVIKDNLNKLPCWEPFFERFAGNQYAMYGLIHRMDGIHKLYEACYRDNLHSIWANRELYRKGNSKEEFFHILEKNMRPVYDSARRQGYEMWIRKDQMGTELNDRV